MRPIDADDLRKKAVPHYYANCIYAVPISVIDEAPTVDAVEVVRCKECKNLYDGPDDYCCIRHVGLVKITPDSFCSYGERRSDV